MDQQLVKLLTFMLNFTTYKYEDGTLPRKIQATYTNLNSVEKAWIDTRLDVSKFYDRANLSEELIYALHEIRNEYMHTYFPQKPLKEVFVWLDKFLRASTFQRLSYDTEYLVWNIERCRESMSAEETAWIESRFSIDTLLRSEVYSKEDMDAMYHAWSELH